MGMFQLLKAMRASMDDLSGKQPSARKILIPISDSPESKAALVWAVENLIRKEDQVLLYHMVKTPTLIPTAMGMVPYSGASPAMQKAHVLVATADGTKLLRSLQAYGTNKKIDVTIEVGRCDNRHAELLRKAKKEAATLLIMGAGGSPRFGLRLGKKQTLSARICRDAECHVILVDKKKRPTIHAKSPAIESVGTSPSEPRGEESDSRGLSPGGGLAGIRAKLALEVPSEIVLGELATPKFDASPAKAQYAILLPDFENLTTAFLSHLKHLRTVRAHTRAARATESDGARAPADGERKESDTPRAQSDGSRTCSQSRELFPLPEWDAEGRAGRDADAKSEGKVTGKEKMSGTGKVGGMKTEDAVGKEHGTGGGRGEVDGEPERGSDANEEAKENADVVADITAEAQTPPLGRARAGGSDCSSLTGVPQSDGASPREKEGRAFLATPRPFGNRLDAIGVQLPSPKTGTVRNAKPPPGPLESPFCSPRREKRPIPSAKALINRVFLALNEATSAGSIKPDPFSKPFLSPPSNPVSNRRRSPARSLRSRGIPPRKRAPADGSRESPVVGYPSIWTFVKPQVTAGPVFGALSENLSNDHPDETLLDDRWTCVRKSQDSRRASARHSLDGQLPDFGRMSAGKALSARQLSAGHFSDVRWLSPGQPPNGRRTSLGISPDARRTFRETAPDSRRNSARRSPDACRTSEGRLGRSPTPSENQTGAEPEALIARLREQVDLLTEIGSLRDREFENVASRAKQAEKAAEERERALLTEKLMREEAELKARRLANQMAALRVHASRANAGADGPIGFAKDELSESSRNERFLSVLPRFPMTFVLPWNWGRTTGENWCTGKAKSGRG
ncbi:hypothetical protein KFL_001450190 [Klebsormidium nitens]|uniref:UspA domain-containing protein n=1 Tax=Klebsormidium nitens TaxID=105231 RepID=A0A1Y1I3Q0_KLENI|nr:hypothetical protein KFL_001450190 [Klebsormidium nitens]|eukprot:GAQ83366.1 hypothetical protein KFL_001450190 [Klebsormidium nitens]